MTSITVHSLDVIKTLRQRYYADTADASGCMVACVEVCQWVLVSRGLEVRLCAPCPCKLERVHAVVPVRVLACRGTCGPVRADLCVRASERVGHQPPQLAALGEDIERMTRHQQQILRADNKRPPGNE